MQASVIDRDERRCAERMVGSDSPWGVNARLRPGQDVTLVNISVGGALVESAARMSPGSRAELQLFGTLRSQVRGRVAHCRVLHVDPLRYQGGIAFDERLAFKP